MRRSLILHEESGLRADGWLLWFVVLFAALALAPALATTAAAATAYYSFWGEFTDGTERQSFLFNIDPALRSPAPFSLRTWQYDGGTNAAGDTYGSGGFDPILRLYNDTPTLIAENDNYLPPPSPARDSLIDWATSGMPVQLAVDNYQLDLVAFGDTLNGRYGQWAVDLVADAAKFTLTGVDNTGATTITSLKLGSDDARVPASLQLGPLENLSIIDGLVVGNTGAGDVTVTTGSLSSGYSYLGLAPGSVGSVTLSLGGYLEATSGFYFSAIGFGGEGNLRVESGSQAIFSYLDLGENSGAEGNVTVTGNDSYLVVNGSLVVAESGVGYLRVEDQGQVNSDYTVLGFVTDGHGTGEVDGLDSLWQTNDLIVGNHGQGTVSITGGGKIDTTGNAYIGYTSDSHDSSATLTGNAPDDTPSTWQVSGNLFIAGSESGASGALESHLTINPGGLVDVAGTTTVWESGGNLELLGGEMETGSLIVKPGATFKHDDGTLTVSGGTFDPGIFGYASYTIDGADPTDLPVVRLTGGATASLLGYGYTFVGLNHHGRLEILSGSRPDAGATLALGYFTGSDGEVIVDGQESQLTAIGGLVVGDEGRGVLRVLNGGSVYNPTSDVETIAVISGSEGIVQVSGTDPDGTPSTYTSNAHLHVGQSGRGTLEITGGGVVNSASAQIAMFPASNGSSATVTDSGSRWAITGPLYVGGDGTSAGGTGTLTVANDGQVTAGSVKVWQTGTVELDSAIISTSTLELAGGTLQGSGAVLVSGALANGGVVSPGVSPGVITVSGGNYVQDSSGLLAIEIGGRFASQYDRLDIVSGTATLAGTLDVSLIDLGGGVFAPSAGDTFEVLTAAGGLAGTTFTTELLPALGGGLFFDVFYEPNAVTLAVLGVPGDYNLNGVVDAADYVVWRKTLGQSGAGLAADGDGDGDVDGDDYGVWTAHFGQTAGSGAVAINSSGRADATIPEPVTLWLAMLGAAATLSSFGRRFMRCGVRTLAVQPCSLRRAAETASQLVARIVWPGLIVLITLVASPCLHPAVAGTIPAAQYHGMIDYYGYYGNTKVETFKEGSVSYDYQGEGDQYVASVQLTGGNALTVDVHGDYQRSGPSPLMASAFGSIRYFFAVSKKDPAAPDSPVPFLISAKAHASAQKGANGTRSPFARAYVSYKHPYATNYEILLTAAVETVGDSRVTMDRTFEGLRAQPPGTLGTIAVVAEGSARQISYNEWAAGSFQAIADPYIRIDPTYTVYVNGVPRLGSEIYGLEFSEGIGSGIPEPASFVLIAVAAAAALLAATTIRRRASRNATSNAPLQRD